MNFGITLSNRGVLVGLCSARDLLVLADAVEACAAMDSVWCGDALFVNRRVDALTLLAAVAGRTERVLLGPACMGSFALRNPLVFAYEWASLDVLSNGRTRLVVVTHPSVIRGAILVALNAPPKSFWRIDIAPVSRTVMYFRGHAWTLRSSL